MRGRQIVVAGSAMRRVTVQTATWRLDVRGLGAKGSEGDLGVVMSRSQGRLSVIVVCCMAMDLCSKDDAEKLVFHSSRFVLGLSVPALPADL